MTFNRRNEDDFAKMGHAMRDARARDIQASGGLAVDLSYIGHKLWRAFTWPVRVAAKLIRR